MSYNEYALTLRRSRMVERRPFVQEVVEHAHHPRLAGYTICGMRMGASFSDIEAIRPMRYIYDDFGERRTTQDGSRLRGCPACLVDVAAEYGLNEDQAEDFEYDWGR